VEHPVTRWFTIHAVRAMVSGVVVEDSVVGAPTAPAEAAQPDLRLSDQSREPDDAARAAATPREQLLVTVADNFLALAEDIKDIAGSRQKAVLALRRLILQLPGDSAAAAAHRLMAIHDTPELSERDRFDFETNTPLSRSRIDTGAGTLAAALIAAAEAFRRAGQDGHQLVGDADFPSRPVAAALPMLRSDAKAARYGAQVIAAVAGASPGLAHHATAMLFHPEAAVRTAGARRAPIDERVFTQLATDPAAEVRAATASRGMELPVAVRDALAADANARLRLTLQHALTTN
jgi:hypothetical protein